jgi:hypothetical protein
MKPIALLLILLTIASTGCKALVLGAEANLVEAETALTETQSDADTIAALLVANQTAIEALRAELEAGRVDRREAEMMYLELLAEQSELLEILAGQSRSKVSPWAIISLIVLLAMGGAAFYRLRGRGIVIMLPPGEQSAGALPPGKQWTIKVPQSIERETIER